MRAGSFDRSRDLGQCYGAVDEYLERVAAARRRLTGRPAGGRCVERAELAEPTQPATMMGDQQPLEPIAQRGVGASEDGGHG